MVTGGPEEHRNERVEDDPGTEHRLPGYGNQAGVQKLLREDAVMKKRQNFGCITSSFLA